LLVEAPSKAAAAVAIKEAENAYQHIAARKMMYAALPGAHHVMLCPRRVPLFYYHC
jgi:hypothetical protein